MKKYLFQFKLQQTITKTCKQASNHYKHSHTTKIHHFSLEHHNAKQQRNNITFATKTWLLAYSSPTAADFLYFHKKCSYQSDKNWQF